MPMTPSHAAAALPLASMAKRLRAPLPVSALVIGTFAPDFEHLLSLEFRSGVSHSPVGLVTFCLPLGLAAWLVWRWLLEPDALRLLPRGLRDRIAAPPGWRRDVALLPWVGVGIVAGAWTHQLWDAFTHPGWWGTVQVERWFPSLSRIDVSGYGWERLAQAVSSLGGAAIVALAVATWVRVVPAQERRYAPSETRRSLRVAGALIAAGLAAGVANVVRADPPDAHSCLAIGALGGMDGMIVASIFLAVGTRMRHPAAV